MPSDRFVLFGRWGVTLRGVACRQVRPGSTSLLLTSHAAERASESGPEGGTVVVVGLCPARQTTQTCISVYVCTEHVCVCDV